MTKLEQCPWLSAWVVWLGVMLALGCGISL